MKYAGWVPTVTGHLSFSSVGDGSFPTSALRQDADGTIFILQRRDLLDVLVPYANDVRVMAFFREKLSNRLIGISGDFDFLMIADPAAKPDTLVGDIWIVPRALAAREARRITKLFRQDEFGADAGADVRRFCAGSQCCHFKFSLERSGKIFLEGNRSSVQSTDQVVHKILANQTFYFLKDICHVHQHHDPRHDAITEIEEVSSSADTSWIASTQHDLYRSIIRYKRFRSEKALFRASGVLAYAQSFSRCYTEGSRAGKIFHDSELEKSLDVARSEMKHFDQKRISQSETFRNAFFALFGAIISATLLGRLQLEDSVSVDPSLVAFTAFAAGYPVLVTTLVLIFSSAYMMITHRLDPSEFELVRFSARAFQSLRLKYYIVVNVIIAIFLGSICYGALKLLASF